MTQSPRASADAAETAAAPGASFATHTLDDSSQDLDLIKVPGIRPRRQGMLLTMAAIVGFALLAALAVMSGGTGPSPTKKPPAEQPTKASRELPTPPPTEVASADSRAATPATPVPSAPAEPAPAEPASAPTAAANPAPVQPIQLPVQPPVQEPPVPSAVVPTAPTREAAMPAAAPPATPPAALAPPMLRVRIKTSPKSAELLIDGSKVSNPFDARLPAGSQHRVQARAAGHLEQDVALTLDQDRTLDLRLARSPAPTSDLIASKRRLRTAATRRKTQRAVVAPTPTPARRTTGAGFVSDSPY